MAGAIFFLEKPIFHKEHKEWVSFLVNIPQRMIIYNWHAKGQKEN